MRSILAISLLIVAALVLVGCSKKTPEETVTAKPEEPIAAKPEAEPTAATPEKVPVKGKDGWVTLPSGLKYKDKKVGTGAEAKTGDTVSVHYKGWLDSGTVFDTSKKPGREPFGFTLGGGQVIQGWDKGVPGMKVGGLRELEIPPSLGYGSQDMGVIPPNSTLHFDVELLNVGG